MFDGIMERLNRFYIRRKLRVSKQDVICMYAYDYCFVCLRLIKQTDVGHESHLKLSENRRNEWPQR